MSVQKWAVAVVLLPQMATPGIGGPNFDEATNYTGAINIESGTITATGYSYGAGIGGGNFSSGGTFNISGGVVTALSGGTDPDGWVSVPENTKMEPVSAEGQAAGSGGINISGGIVKAYGGYGCPGIGGAPCDVTISGQCSGHWATAVTWRQVSVDRQIQG